MGHIHHIQTFFLKKAPGSWTQGNSSYPIECLGASLREPGWVGQKATSQGRAGLLTDSPVSTVLSMLRPETGNSCQGANRAGQFPPGAGCLQGSLLSGQQATFWLGLGLKFKSTGVSSPPPQRVLREKETLSAVLEFRPHFLPTTLQDSAIPTPSLCWHEKFSPGPCCSDPSCIHSGAAEKWI